MTIRKQPKKFLMKSKPKALAHKVSAPRRSSVSVKVAPKSVSRVSFRPSSPIKSKVSGRVASVVSGARKIKGRGVYPDFSEVDNLLHFSALLYLLALTPLLSRLAQTVNVAYLPEYAAPVILAERSVELAVAPSAAVLGDSSEMGLPTTTLQDAPIYPNWKATYYNAEDYPTAGKTEEITAEFLDYKFSPEDLGVTGEGESLVVWETVFDNDVEDLYNYYVAAPATARVYLDDTLVLEKTEAETESYSESASMTLGEHRLRVELDATSATNSFQFLFY